MTDPEHDHGDTPITWAEIEAVPPIFVAIYILRTRRFGPFILFNPRDN